MWKSRYEKCNRSLLEMAEEVVCMHSLCPLMMLGVVARLVVPRPNPLPIACSVWFSLRYAEKAWESGNKATNVHVPCGPSSMPLCKQHLPAIILQFTCGCLSHSQTCTSTSLSTNLSLLPRPLLPRPPQRLSHEETVAGLRGKCERLERLCRALQGERSDLTRQLKEVRVGVWRWDGESVEG